MNQMESIKQFMNSKFVVNCKTENEAKYFLRILKEHGMKWVNGSDLNEFTNWGPEKDRTCYRALFDSSLVYGSEPFYRFEEKIDIRSFSELFSENLNFDMDEFYNLIDKM